MRTQAVQPRRHGLHARELELAQGHADAGPRQQQATVGRVPRGCGVCRPTSAHSSNTAAWQFSRKPFSATTPVSPSTNARWAIQARTPSTRSATHTALRRQTATAGGVDDSMTDRPCSPHCRRRCKEPGSRRCRRMQSHQALRRSIQVHGVRRLCRRAASDSSCGVHMPGIGTSGSMARCGDRMPQEPRPGTGGGSSGRHACTMRRAERRPPSAAIPR